MKNKIIQTGIFIIILSFTIVSALSYTPDPYNNIQSSLTGEYTPDDYDSIQSDLGDGDSCDTNNWDCTENCNVENYDAGGNIITASGIGNITIEGNVTNCLTGGVSVLIKGGCKVTTKGGNQLC